MFQLGYIQNILGLNVIRHESGFCYLISLHFCFNVKTDHYDIFPKQMHWFDKPEKKYSRKKTHSHNVEKKELGQIIHFDITYITYAEKLKYFIFMKVKFSFF